MILKDDLKEGITAIATIEQDKTPAVQEDIPQIEILRQAKLTSLEKSEMESFVAMGRPGIQHYPHSQLLETYLSGADTSELVQIFPNTSVGGIAYLKAKENWVEKRKEFLEDLQYKAKLKLLQTKNNAVSTLSLLINAFHKEIQPAILKYLQTGDKKHLPARFSIKNFNDYARFMKLLEGISKVQSTSSGGKSNDNMSLYPPIAIQADNITISDNSNPKSESQSEKKENVSDAAFEFLKQMYEGKKNG